MITLKKSIEQGFSGMPNGLYDVLTELQTEITAIKADWANVVCDAVITPGAAHTDTIAATIQLKDYLGADMAVSNSVIAYLSSDAAGLNKATAAPTTDLDNGTDGEVEILLASHVYLLTSEVDGDIDVTLGYTTGAHDFFLVVILPNGKRIVSTKFEFTA